MASLHTGVDKACAVLNATGGTGSGNTGGTESGTPACDTTNAAVESSEGQPVIFRLFNFPSQSLIFRP